ncbi:MAG: HDIG domain-containing protein [Chloroflexi bacterium]|nr:HDIG domain-containing protein [Chloroflexota bacterium]
MAAIDSHPRNNTADGHTLWRSALYVLLLGGFIVAGAVIIAYDVLTPNETKVALEVGGVAPRDILAPRSLKYDSDVLTHARRDAEAAAVRPIYDPPDLNVMREQVQLARDILDFIENVRYDDFATLDQQREDLAAITALTLDPPVVDTILMIEDDSAWRAISTQIVHLLERVMSGEVREDNIQARRDSLSNLISASFSESETRIIQAIVSDLLRVNAYYNDELTRQAQAEAAQNVPVEVRTFVRGQIIIREGEIATAAHIEALEQFGLLEVGERRMSRFTAALLAMGLVSIFLAVYIRRYFMFVYASPTFMITLGALFLIFLLGARTVYTDDAIRPYYFPAAALAFLISTLVGPQLAIMGIVSLAALVGYMSGYSLEYAVLTGFGGVLGVLALGRTERLNAYFVAGGVVGLASAAVALVFDLGRETDPDVVALAAQVGGSLVNGLLSAAFALVGLYVVGYILNIPTSLKLAELMQPNHPLLQRMLREAPGTYQHSLQVANLAELGAQQIDANAALVRVAAMYHDVGKILNPHFFIENQAEGVNPHDGLDDPHKSARIIIGHVPEGDRLARNHHLPSKLREFIFEHHGTTQVIYFYRKALERAEDAGEKVNIADFTYPGPRPRTRESAILMLADGCESSVRARRPQSKQEVQETVDYIFDARLREHQLDESGLTLSDLAILRDTFLAALQGVFHSRITYPGTPGTAEPAPVAAQKEAVGVPPGATEEQAARVAASLGPDALAHPPVLGAIAETLTGRRRSGNRRKGSTGPLRSPDRDDRDGNSIEQPEKREDKHG